MIAERSIVYSEGLIWQVILSEPGRTILLPKYRVGGRGLLYSRVVRDRLARLVFHYKPYEIAKVRGESLDPCLDGKPVSLRGARSLVCDPLCRREELLEEPRDALERIAASLISQLEYLGVRVYPTGSLLGYYHDPHVSDIDLVVYLDETPCEAAIEALNALLKPLPDNAVYRWARTRRVTPLLYRRWLYGVYEGVRVSTVFAYTSRPSCEAIVWPLGARTVLRGRIEPLGCRTLAWPHIAVVETGGGESLIASFDGVYAPILYEGGRATIEGIAGIVKRGLVEGNGVILGVAEAPGRLSPLL